VKDPSIRNPKHVTIKVTDSELRCYFVHFDRATRDVVEVAEYKVVYRPWMSAMPRSVKNAIDAAKTKITETILATETKETTSETEL
jgi:hypothetical protein